MGCGCPAYGAGASRQISGQDVAGIIETGAGLTDTVLSMVPGLQRSQIERLGKQRGRLLRELANARSTGERRAIQAELDAVEFQLRQAQQTAQAAQQPMQIVVQDGGGAGWVPWALGGLILVGAVGGAIYLARR